MQLCNYAIVQFKEVLQVELLTKGRGEFPTRRKHPPVPFKWGIYASGKPRTMSREPHAWIIKGTVSISAPTGENIPQIPSKGGF